MKKRQLVVVAAAALSTVFATGTAVPASAATSPNSITTNGCGPAQAQWVRVSHLNGSTCYGGKGTINPPGNTMVAFCAGNNGGNFTYRVGGKDTPVQFWPGTQITWPTNDPVDLVSLTITGWSGPFTC